MNKMVEIRSIDVNDMTRKEDGTYQNEIVLTPYKQMNAKNLARESELHRILLHLRKEDGELAPEKNQSGYTVIPSYFTLDVGRSVERYHTLIACKGELTIINKQYVLDENGNKVLGEDNHYLLETTGEDKYVATFCGAGHARAQKNLFVQEDIVDKLNDILLCGMPKSLVYERPSKWNAYYALVATGSTPLTYMPNIVVIKDYKKTMKQKTDIVEVSGTGANKKYIPIGHKGKKHHKELLEIMPFDGAGLVTPECALKWAKELNCQSAKKEFYLPSCFQFRAIPGIKGEVMVFDIKRFAREKKVSKIVDLGGKEWDIFKDKIDVVLTQSQFKFWQQYLDNNGCFDYQLWRSEFDRACHGYRRTFNIVSYGAHPDDLADKTMLSYQPLQSLNFTEKEIAEVSSMGIHIYRKAASDIDGFLKYRGLIKISDETGEAVENIVQYTPPYYAALLHNRDLFYDNYVHGKVVEDVRKLRNSILSGKIFVNGNYQVLMPDLYGLAEWAFHDELGHEPQGLLHKPYHIYSAWWNDRKAQSVDIMRNPAVGMEHRIGHLRNGRELTKWFKFQTTGIVTGMYDTLALSLNGADYDGDTVCTTDNIHLMNAVKRELKAGNGRLVLKKTIGDLSQKEAPKGIPIADRAALMKVNQMAFKNSIGHIIDRVTDMWTYLKVNESEIRSYIMIGVIVGSETIDFAKTGENAALPAEITDFLKGGKRGWWMRYLPRHNKEAMKEEKAIKTALASGKDAQEIEKMRKFVDYDCNMNRLCHYAEEQIAAIDAQFALKASEPGHIFDYRKRLLRSQPVINRKVYRMVQVLQEEYRNIAMTYRKESLKSKAHQRTAANKFRWFYAKCRTELLFLEPDVDKLIDMLVVIYYGDKKGGAGFLDLEKDILWNAFPDEMLVRCSDKSIRTNIDFSKLEENHKRNVEYAKKQKAVKADKKKVVIKSIESMEAYRGKYVTLTKGDRAYINNVLNKAYMDKKVRRKDNVAKLKRVLAILVYLSRKCEDEKGLPQWIKKLDNVPDEITDMTLEKLTSVGHKNMDMAIALFDKMGIVESRITGGGTKIKVLFPCHEGEIWFGTDDYNKAGTMIRDYFRNDKEAGFSGNGFREGGEKAS